MPVMIVVSVSVSMHDPFVLMLVSMRFGEVKPDPETHQEASHEYLQRCRLTQHDDRDRGAHERGGREIRARPRGADVPQGDHEQNEAHAITGEARDAREGDRNQIRDSAVRRQREQKVGASRDEPLDHSDLHGIT